MDESNILAWFLTLKNRLFALFYFRFWHLLLWLTGRKLAVHLVSDLKAGQWPSLQLTCCLYESYFRSHRIQKQHIPTRTAICLLWQKFTELMNQITVSWLQFQQDMKNTVNLPRLDALEAGLRHGLHISTGCRRRLQRMSQTLCASWGFWSNSDWDQRMLICVFQNLISIRLVSPVLPLRPFYYWNRSVSDAATG